MSASLNMYCGNCLSDYKIVHPSHKSINKFCSEKCIEEFMNDDSVRVLVNQERIKYNQTKYKCIICHQLFKKKGYRYSADLRCCSVKCFSKLKAKTWCFFLLKRRVDPAWSIIPGMAERIIDAANKKNNEWMDEWNKQEFSNAF